MKLPCAVVRDLLPLYADKMMEPETQKLVEEHLQDCPDCRERLGGIDTGLSTPIESTRPLEAIKKEIRKRRWYTALVAALLVFVVLFTCFFHENQLELIPWQDGLIKVEGVEMRPYGEVFEFGEATDPEQPEVEVLVLKVDGIINGWRSSEFVDEDGKRTDILQAWSSGWNSGNLLMDYKEIYLSPVPDRLIYSDGKQHYLVWGEPMNGGVEELPRLALAYYFIFAAALALILGAGWFFLRKRKESWIPRQAFFAPVSYGIAHLLIKGNRTESFFMERDFLSILLVAVALYALFTIAWQIWLQRRRAA